MGSQAFQYHLPRVRALVEKQAPLWKKCVLPISLSPPESRLQTAERPTDLNISAFMARAH
jgi:hypothetical protein